MPRKAAGADTITFSVSGQIQSSSTFNIDHDVTINGDTTKPIPYDENRLQGLIEKALRALPNVNSAVAKYDNNADVWDLEVILTEPLTSFTLDGSDLEKASGTVSSTLTDVQNADAQRNERQSLFIAGDHADVVAKMRRAVLEWSAGAVVGG